MPESRKQKAEKLLEEEKIALSGDPDKEMFDVFPGALQSIYEKTMIPEEKFFRLQKARKRRLLSLQHNYPHLFNKVQINMAFGEGLPSQSDFVVKDED